MSQKMFALDSSFRAIKQVEYSNSYDELITLNNGAIYGFTGMNEDETKKNIENPPYLASGREYDLNKAVDDMIFNVGYRHPDPSYKFDSSKYIAVSAFKFPKDVLYPEGFGNNRLSLLLSNERQCELIQGSFPKAFFIGAPYVVYKNSILGWGTYAMNGKPLFYLDYGINDKPDEYSFLKKIILNLVDKHKVTPTAPCGFYIGHFVGLYPLFNGDYIGFSRDDGYARSDDFYWLNNKNGFYYDTGGDKIKCIRVFNGIVEYGWADFVKKVSGEWNTAFKIVKDGIYYFNPISGMCVYVFGFDYLFPPKAQYFEFLRDFLLAMINAMDKGYDYALDLWASSEGAGYNYVFKKITQ